MEFRTSQIADSAARRPVSVAVLLCALQCVVGCELFDRQGPKGGPGLEPPRASRDVPSAGPASGDDVEMEASDPQAGFGNHDVPEPVENGGTQQPPSAGMGGGGQSAAPPTAPEPGGAGGGSSGLVDGSATVDAGSCQDERTEIGSLIDGCVIDLSLLPSGSVDAGAAAAADAGSVDGGSADALAALVIELDQSASVPIKASALECGFDPGFYRDPDDPDRLVLCPLTCQQVAFGSELEMVFSCQ